MADDDVPEFQRELREALKVFVDGMNEGIENLKRDGALSETMNAEAEMIAALFDVAIGLCLKRGMDPHVIANATMEHALLLQQRTVSPTAN